MADFVEHGLRHEERRRELRVRDEVDLVQDDVGVDEDPRLDEGWDGGEVGGGAEVVLPLHCKRRPRVSGVDGDGGVGRSYLFAASPLQILPRRT